MRLDADDLDEAIASAAFTAKAGHQTATDTEIFRLRSDLARLVMFLPIEATVGDLRELLRVRLIVFDFNEV